MLAVKVQLFSRVLKASQCLLFDRQVEPEDAAVQKLLPVVPRGLHSVSDQAAAVRRQVRY